MIYVWLGLIILFAIVEALTLSLNSIWFSFGALLAMIAASLDWHLSIQIGIFLVGSAILLVLTKPLIKKYVRIKQEKTNSDRIIGQIGYVIEDISNLDAKGQIKILGQVWSARSDSGQKIDAGARVRVLRIEGVKAYVQAIKEQEEQQ